MITDGVARYALMTQYWIMLIYSLLLFMMTIFRKFDTRYDEFLVYVKDSIR